MGGLFSSPPAGPNFDQAAKELLVLYDQRPFEILDAVYESTGDITVFVIYRTSKGGKVRYVKKKEKGSWISSPTYDLSQITDAESEFAVQFRATQSLEEKKQTHEFLLALKRRFPTETFVDSQTADTLLCNMASVVRTKLKQSKKDYERCG